MIMMMAGGSYVASHAGPREAGEHLYLSEVSLVL